MLNFTHDNRDYELKMTRAGVRAAEGQGLATSDIAEKPFQSISLLFFASLYSQYKLNPAKATAMLDDLLDDGVFEPVALFEELAEAYGDLFGLVESEKE